MVEIRNLVVPFLIERSPDESGSEPACSWRLLEVRIGPSQIDCQTAAVKRRSGSLGAGSNRAALCETVKWQLVKSKNIRFVVGVQAD